MKNIKWVLLVISFIFGSVLIQAGPLDTVPSNGDPELKDTVYLLLDFTQELKELRDSKENERKKREESLRILKSQITRFLTQQIIPKELLIIYFDLKKRSQENRNQEPEDFFRSWETAQQKEFLKLMRPYLEQLEKKKQKRSKVLSRL